MTSSNDDHNPHAHLEWLDDERNHPGPIPDPPVPDAKGLHLEYRAVFEYPQAHSTRGPWRGTKEHVLRDRPDRPEETHGWFARTEARWVSDTVVVADPVPPVPAARRLRPQRCPYCDATPAAWCVHRVRDVEPPAYRS